MLNIDTYMSYYTKSQFITGYMVKMLDLNDNDVLLEPAVGEGVFIDEVLKEKPNLDIKALDMNPEAIKILNEKYANMTNIKVIETDTLFDESLDKYVIQNGHYDKVIGNPPYGAWQDKEKRKRLKNRYEGYYVKETYTLFLLRCISLLKKGGKLSFIVPDTFMNLHMHNQFREYLLLNTKINEILIFPSKFFPGVSYGYSKMCIITVEKTADIKDSLENELRIITNFKKSSDLKKVTNEEDLSEFKVERFNQLDIYESLDKAFLISGGNGIRHLINNHEEKLGSVANCVTGIYTGDNKRFFKVASEKVRNQSKCPIIKEEEICEVYLDKENLIEGIEGERHFIAVAKGNADRYVRDVNWYIDWSKGAVNAYHTDKKARFQNSSYYFKKGIALPMVKSAKIKANLIEEQVFDQSVVGVFPKEEEHLLYLLGYFNSEVFTKIVHTINPSANNSSNYIKKIPVIITPEGLDFVNPIVQQIIDTLKETNKFNEDLQKELDDYFNSIYAEWLEIVVEEEKDLAEV